MSERIPEQPTEFEITCGEDRYNLTPKNTFIFLHSEEPDYDHFYLVQNDDPEEGDDGLVFFREHLGNFENMKEAMILNNFTVIRRETVADIDRQIYFQQFGRYADKVKTYELTNRHEELISRFGSTILAMPVDLLYDELTMPHDRKLPEQWV